jgi:hypothetical protein
MSAVVGLAMVFAAILIGRAAKIGIPLEAPPWWANDNMSAFVISPSIVTLFAGGVAAIVSWALGGAWRATNVTTVLGLAADIAVYVVLSGVIKAWAQRVRPVAPVVPVQPQPSGNRPPLKKAA